MNMIPSIEINTEKINALQNIVTKKLIKIVAAKIIKQNINHYL